MEGAGYPTDGIDSEVRLIDQWSEKKVAFAEAEITANNERQEMSLAGLCARDKQGQLLQWKLSEPEDEDYSLDRGEVYCTRGGFQVHLRDLQELDCDHYYSIRVETREGEVDYTFLRRECSI